MSNELSALFKRFRELKIEERELKVEEEKIINAIEALVGTAPSIGEPPAIVQVSPRSASSSNAIEPNISNASHTKFVRSDKVRITNKIQSIKGRPLNEGDRVGKVTSIGRIGDRFGGADPGAEAQRGGVAR